MKHAARKIIGALGLVAALGLNGCGMQQNPKEQTAINYVRGFSSLTYSLGKQLEIGYYNVESTPGLSIEEFTDGDYKFVFRDDAGATYEVYLDYEPAFNDKEHLHRKAKEIRLKLKRPNALETMEIHDSLANGLDEKDEITFQDASQVVNRTYGALTLAKGSVHDVYITGIYALSGRLRVIEDRLKTQINLEREIGKLNKEMVDKEMEQAHRERQQTEKQNSGDQKQVEKQKERQQQEEKQKQEEYLQSRIKQFGKTITK